MPEERLNVILLNLQKSVKRIWSRELIVHNSEELQEIISDRPALLDDPVVLNVVSQIKKLLKAKLVQLEYSSLPVEFPHPRCELEEINFRVYRPVMASIPPPQPMKNSKFSEWVEAMENYFKLSDVTTEKQSRFFVHCIGQENLDKISSSVKPRKVSDLSYDELVAAGKVVFETAAKSQATVKFLNIIQGSDTVQDYAFKLKNLSVQCSIQDNKFLTIKFINGLANYKLKFEMLKAKFEDFDTAIDQALVLEQIMKDQTESVNKVKFGGSDHQNKSKSRKFSKNPKDNKKPNDKNKKVRVQKDECFYCKKKGHWKKDCLKYKQKLGGNVDDIDQQLGSVHLRK